MMRGYTLFLELIRGKNRVCVVIRHILRKQPYYAKNSVLLEALFMAHVLGVGELIKMLFEWCRFLLPVWSYGAIWTFMWPIWSVAEVSSQLVTRSPRHVCRVERFFVPS